MAVVDQFHLQVHGRAPDDVGSRLARGSLGDHLVVGAVRAEIVIGDLDAVFLGHRDIQVAG